MSTSADKEPANFELSCFAVATAEARVRQLENSVAVLESAECQMERRRIAEQLGRAKARATMLRKQHEKWLKGGTQ